MTLALAVLRILRFPLDLLGDIFGALERVFADLACLVVAAEDAVERERKRRIKARRHKIRLSESVVRDIERIPEKPLD